MLVPTGKFALNEADEEAGTPAFVGEDEGYEPKARSPSPSAASSPSPSPKAILTLNLTLALALTRSLTQTRRRRRRQPLRWVGATRATRAL